MSIASAIRWAVVKSGLRRVSRSWLIDSKSKPVSCSTMAPSAIRPAVGTPRVIDEPEAPLAETEPVCTVPCAAA